LSRERALLLTRLLLLSLPEQIIQGGIDASLVLEAVRQGTEQIRSELREKTVEFATVKRDYSDNRGEEHGLCRDDAQYHRRDQLTY
jgi:hypothetical protein